MLWRHKKKANIEAKEQPKDNDIKQWITVNGVHIPIKKGQNKDDVVDDFISKQKDEPKKDTPKTDKPKRNYKVGIVSDKKKLDVADKVLSDLPDDFVNKDLKFTDSTNTSEQGSHEFGKAEVYLNNIPDEDIGSVITHELGHANFGDNDIIDRIMYGSLVMALPEISNYSSSFKNEVYSTQDKLKRARNDFKQLSKDATDDEKRIAQKKLENAEIDYSLAISNLGDEYYADLQSWKHGYPPKTKTNISKEEIDDIIKKTDKALKNPDNKQMYNMMFPSLAKESICPNCGEPKEAVNLVGIHPTAQVKKKKRFEFKEDTNDDWKEYEHYLYEDATKSGQKSDTVGNPEFRSFTHSSSFVGNVLWHRESNEMDIILNGKKYHFCNVSERLFDAFEGADSKGAFFNREIKSLHDC